MNERIPLLFAGKLTVASLIVASAGVVIQIVSGHDYTAHASDEWASPVPPVFFFLLIPAALIAFGRWRWTPAIAVLAGLFLTSDSLRAERHIAYSTRAALAIRWAYGSRCWQ